MQAVCTRNAIVFGALVAFVGRAEEGADKKTAIPLDSIYATRANKQLRKIPIEFAKNQAFSELSSNQARAKEDVYLVGGETIGDAVNATHKVANQIDGGFFEASKGGKDKAWMVALLGTSGSNPPEWTVESVERIGNKIKVRYKRQPARTNVRYSRLLFLDPFG